MEQINKDDTRRELTNFNVQMIALGGAIGTGLFLGAGQTIHRTGPSILLVYLVVGLFFSVMMRAIGILLSRSFINIWELFLANLQNGAIG